MVSGALAEVKVSRVADLTPDQYSIVLNIIKRRLPVKRSGALVQEHSPMENYGYEFRNENSKYGWEKDRCDYERME